MYEHRRRGVAQKLVATTIFQICQSRRCHNIELSFLCPFYHGGTTSLCRMTDQLI